MMKEQLEAIRKGALVCTVQEVAPREGRVD